MAQIAEEIQNRGATAIDMNCGCPSRTVTKKGCGSALLDEPEQLKKILHALRSALTIPLTLKIRRGFKDSANFDRILDIAEDCGVDLVTIHPRLTTEMYNGKADWSYIDRAVQKLSIPVVGNGDIKTAIEACKRLKNHGCKAVMIGRSALADPYLFEQATQLFKGNEYTPSTPQQLVEFFDQLMAKYEKNYKSENMALARGKGHLRYLDWERFSLDDAALRPIFRSKTVVDFLTKLKNMLNQ
jgi:tRNA-dihydrouridine synthase C